MENGRDLAALMGGRVTVSVGDLTRERVDAIVNAANSLLLGGGGVDGAIHMAGGPKILLECRKIRASTHREGLPAGEAVITTGGDLPAKHVIHTVGPIYGRNNGRDAELLAACYTNSLRLAAESDLATIAFPSISTGAYRYPREEAAEVASQAIADFLSENDTIAEVRLVFHSRSDAEVFMQNHQFGQPNPQP